MLYGSHPYLRALDESVREAPTDFGAVQETRDVFVELAPMSGLPAEALPAIETHWFAPARVALSAGQLEALTIVANDRVFQIGAGNWWKFWRRRRNWLQSLLKA